MYALHRFRRQIYTLVITTYRMNKGGFDCALSSVTSRAVFSPILCFPTSFSPLIFSSIIPRLLALFFFYLVSHQVSNPLTFGIHLAYRSFFYTTTPRDSVEVYPPKVNFILLDTLACPKINITIYLFIYLTHATRSTLHEGIHRICGSLGNKRWRR